MKYIATGGAIGSACIHIKRNSNKAIHVKNYAYLGNEYKKNQIEIKVLTYELFHKENRIVND